MFWNDFETTATRSNTGTGEGSYSQTFQEDKDPETPLTAHVSRPDAEPEKIPLKPSETQRDNGGAKMLMIHQLWLWKLCESALPSTFSFQTTDLTLSVTETVITSCPSRWHAGVEDTLIDTIRQGGIEGLKEPEDLIQLIMYECATFLDEFRYAGMGDHILDIFDSTTGLRVGQATLLSPT